MPVINAVLKNGATSLTPTGGVDLTFTDHGTEVKNGAHVAAGDADADFRLCPSIVVKNRKSSMQPDGSWSKEKRERVYTQPRLLENGIIGFELIRIETEVYPDIDAVSRRSLDLNGAQLLTDGDFDEFNQSGSLK